MIDYLKGVMREFKNIKWPTTKMTIYYTVGVIAVSFIVAVYIGILDFSLITFVNKYLI